MTAYNFPALVLYDAGDQDVLVARITTQEYSTISDYKIVEWRESGLIAESFVRLGKLATIEKGFVIRKLGLLTETDAVKSILRKMFGL